MKIFHTFKCEGFKIILHTFKRDDFDFEIILRTFKCDDLILK